MLYYVKVRKFVKLAYIGILENFCVVYYIKVMKFVKLAYNVFWKIFVSYYIKVTKFVKLAKKIGLFEDLCVLYYIKVTKFINLRKFDIFEDCSCAILHKSHEVC